MRVLARSLLGFFFHLFWQLGSLCPCPVLKTRAQRWWTNTMRSTWMPYTSCLTSIRSSTAAPTPRSCFSCDWRDSPWEHLLWRESESPGKGSWRRLAHAQRGDIKSSFLTIVLPLPTPPQELSLRSSTPSVFRGVHPEALLVSGLGWTWNLDPEGLKQWPSSYHSSF